MHRKGIPVSHWDPDDDAADFRPTTCSPQGCTPVPSRTAKQPLQFHLKLHTMTTDLPLRSFHPKKGWERVCLLRAPADTVLSFHLDIVNCRSNVPHASYENHDNIALCPASQADHCGLQRKYWRGESTAEVLPSPCSSNFPHSHCSLRSRWLPQPRQPRGHPLPP